MSAGWLELLAAATLKSTLWLALAGMASLLMWRRSASLRHLAWAGAIAGALALPLLQVALPEWPVPLGSGWASSPVVLTGARHPSQARDNPGPAVALGFPAAQASPAAPASSASSTGASPVVKRPGSGVADLLLALWMAGVIVTLAPLALAFVRIARLAHHASPLASSRWSTLSGRAARAHGLDPQRLVLRRAGESVTPLTWGVVRPVLILPDSCEAWSDERAFEVLVHEAGHVRRHDCATQLLASAACVVYWFNPLVWLASRRMLTERERACDDFVLLAGARASDYANDLLDVARSLGAPWATSHVTTAMARRSQIAGRLLAVLDPELDRTAAGRRALLGAAALAVTILVPLASATPDTGGADGASLAVVREAGPSGAQPVTPVAPGLVAALPLDLAAAAREIRSAEREYAAAFARQDLEALAGFYTADAQVAVPDFPIANGRQGVSSLLQRVFDVGVTRIAVEVREVFPVGELLCETGTARFATASGAAVPAEQFMTLWKNEEGRWRIHREWASR